ncbi:hypothetical protein H6F74_26245 [Trichocoleus sp. FACHB-90]|uniref:hypothetical protein n=1 Tax=Cyanophyceae TaxID=3028117 RepID=UPI00168625BA|nr:hypothetical protein [Trichocoleus sp. FACHB-90]MBD1929707.1 hypothetical protein [Trichocoleus sp. FACHB-90]
MQRKRRRSHSPCKGFNISYGGSRFDKPQRRRGTEGDRILDVGVKHSGELVCGKSVD